MKTQQNQFSLDFSTGTEYDYAALPSHYHYIYNNQPLTDIFHSITSSNVVAFDIETYGSFRADGLRPWEGKPRLLQFGLPDGTVYLFDLLKLDAKSITEIQNFTREFLGNPAIKKLVHNGKFDFVFMLYWLGKRTRIRNCFDTYISSVMLYSGIALGSAVPLYRFGLGYCVKRELGIEIDKSLQASEWGNENLSPDQILYAAKDVEILFALMDAIIVKFGENKDRLRCLEIENQVIPVMSRMEANGIPIDVDKVKRSLAVHKACYDENYKIFSKAYPGQKTGGKGLLKHINATKDLELTELTADVLTTLGKDDKALSVLSYLRTLEKSINYLDNILLNVRDGRVYSSFTQLSATSVGRTASKAAVGKNLGGTAKDGLNLQNVPKLAPGIDKEYSIRSCFKMDVISDYAAAHSKICVEAAQDKVSIEIERNGGDIHLFTASTLAEMLGLDLTFDDMMKIKKDSSHPRYKEVKNLRDLSKNTRYSSFNLGGAARLQQTCLKKGIEFSLDQCKAAIVAWRDVHSDIYQYQMSMIKLANSRSIIIDGHEFGWIDSICGVRHYLRKFPGKFGNSLQVNASDCMSVLWLYTEAAAAKLALIKIQLDFDEHPEWEAEISLLCHDEIDVQCGNDDYIEDVAKCVFNNMDSTMKGYVKCIPTTTDTYKDTYLLSSGNRVTTWADK